MELVTYNESLSDVISCCHDQGFQRVATDLVVNFREQSVNLALAILDEAKKQQQASLFRAPPPG